MTGNAAVPAAWKRKGASPVKEETKSPVPSLQSPVTSHESCKCSSSAVGKWPTIVDPYSRDVLEGLLIEQMPPEFSQEDLRGIHLFAQRDMLFTMEK